MKTEKYQGWTNKQTWAFNLYITNTKAEQNYWRERTKENLTTKEPLFDLTKELNEWFEKVFDSVIEGMSTTEAKLLIRDVGNGNDINWYEISERLIDALKGG